MWVSRGFKNTQRIHTVGTGVPPASLMWILTFSFDSALDSTKIIITQEIVEKHFFLPHAYVMHPSLSTPLSYTESFRAPTKFNLSENRFSVEINEL